MFVFNDVDEWVDKVVGIDTEQENLIENCRPVHSVAENSHEHLNLVTCPGDEVNYEGEEDCYCHILASL